MSTSTDHDNRLTEFCHSATLTGQVLKALTEARRFVTRQQVQYSKFNTASSPDSSVRCLRWLVELLSGGSALSGHCLSCFRTMCWSKRHGRRMTTFSPRQAEAGIACAGIPWNVPPERVYCPCMFAVWVEGSSPLRPATTGGITQAPGMDGRCRPSNKAGGGIGRAGGRMRRHRGCRSRILSSCMASQDGRVVSQI